MMKKVHAMITNHGMNPSSTHTRWTRLIVSLKMVTLAFTGVIFVFGHLWESLLFRRLSMTKYSWIKRL